VSRRVSETKVQVMAAPAVVPCSAFRLVVKARSPDSKVGVRGAEVKLRGLSLSIRADGSGPQRSALK
jgi:hypothetical protein